ncbi:hypothetical protein VP01_2795g1 [Puccinia sorghi]|uniref:Uncharacterized protein n=1 Tax=Puccinia sorghi TaxID=27349 RepID=A0A0L6V4E4_9BASI|nr:hypothetical protein VP01_2795g1 [Puccinia sorghi]
MRTSFFIYSYGLQWVVKDCLYFVEKVFCVYIYAQLNSHLVLLHETSSFLSCGKFLSLSLSLFPHLYIGIGLALRLLILVWVSHVWWLFDSICFRALFGFCFSYVQPLSISGMTFILSRSLSPPLHLIHQCILFGFGNRLAHLLQLISITRIFLFYLQYYTSLFYPFFILFLFLYFYLLYVLWYANLGHKIIKTFLMTLSCRDLSQHIRVATGEAKYTQNLRMGLLWAVLDKWKGVVWMGLFSENCKSLTFSKIPVFILVWGLYRQRDGRSKFLLVAEMMQRKEGAGIRGGVWFQGFEQALEEDQADESCSGGRCRGKPPAEGF